MKTLIICLMAFYSAPLLAQSSTTKISQPKSAQSKSWFVNYFHMKREFLGTFKNTGDYSMVPESLDVTQQSLSLGYNLGSSNYLFTTANYIKNDIELKPTFSIPGQGTMPNVEDSTEGLSDTVIGVRKSISPNRQTKTDLSLGVSLPTGSYKEKTTSGAYVSYPGQLGSGTVDLVPEIKMQRRYGNLEFGSGVKAKIRSGRNDLEYRLGNEYRLQLSANLWLAKFFALTSTFYYKKWERVTGAENIVAFNDDVRAQAAAKRRAEAMKKGQHGGPPSRVGGPRNGGPGAGGPGAGGPPPGTGSGQPPQASAGGPPPGVSALSNMTSEDPFSAAGARSTLQVGAKTLLYFGPIFMGFVEVGVPVYHNEDSELDGLENSWYVMSNLVSTF